jgi:APA family basic amino acid/polyamine antiporter
MTLKSDLPRSLTRFDAIMLIIGNMIGIGIFTTTGYIAGYINSSILLLLIWSIGALYSYCGAITYSALSTRFPVSGGDFHYLKTAFHPLFGFLFGWSTFTVTYTGSIATIAVGFATYFHNLLPKSFLEFSISIPLTPLYFTSIKLIAILITILLTWINARGVKHGARFQNFFSIAGIGVIFAFVIAGILSEKANTNNFFPLWPDSLSLNELSLLGVALVSIVFTYAGWTTIVYIAGEIKNPEKNIPSAMLISVTLVAFIYVIMNLIYLLALPMAEMKNIVDIGYMAMQHLFNEDIGILFAIIIMLLSLSSLNSTILSGARIYYAMAIEGKFFKIIGKLHQTRKVPAMSLWAQCIWSVVLIISGSFNQLLTYTVFIMVLFSFLSGIALFIIRKRERNNIISSPIYGYPYIPLIYVVFSTFIMISIFYNRPLESLIGIFIVCLGIPFYTYWRNKAKKSVA